MQAPSLAEVIHFIDKRKLVQIEPYSHPTVKYGYQRVSNGRQLCLIRHAWHHSNLLSNVGLSHKYHVYRPWKKEN